MNKKRTGESYILDEVFIDNYEYEAYFSVASNIEISQIAPKELDVELTLNNRTKIKIHYPDDKRVVIIVPILKKHNNPKKKAEIRLKYLSKFQSVIPEIKLNLRDQLAIRRKLLVNSKDKVVIERKVKKLRSAGARKLKEKIGASL